MEPLFVFHLGQLGEPLPWLVKTGCAKWAQPGAVDWIQAMAKQCRTRWYEGSGSNRAYSSADYMTLCGQISHKDLKSQNKLYF